ncbi:unnamed protein product [Periconia digitata]|uniref:Uncharacterized protein n=1 Tax=Periconia digitata TaxID=1303443 RepID=A0A9W4XEV9_9PLEO|nr:unnamed protein product [Periconia digitata]
MAQLQSFLAKAITKIILDAQNRGYIIVGAMASLPVVVGVPTPGYPNLDSPNPDYHDFALEQSDNATVLADSLYFRAGNMEFVQWASRADKIRHTSSHAYCMGNLSLALEGVGAAYQASSSGSTTLLTLLPTVGALVGPPAKELWVLYKLVPLAGFFSSVLALGGSIVPQQVSEYASLEDFSYSGMPSANAVDGMMKRRPSGKMWTEQAIVDPQVVAAHFADQVYARAMDSRGSSKTWKVALGMVGMVACILLICCACAILSRGSIVVWWCRVSWNGVRCGYG